MADSSWDSHQEHSVKTCKRTICLFAMIVVVKVDTFPQEKKHVRPGSMLPRNSVRSANVGVCQYRWWRHREVLTRACVLMARYTLPSHQFIVLLIIADRVNLRSCRSFSPPHGLLCNYQVLTLTACVQWIASSQVWHEHHTHVKQGKPKQVSLPCNVLTPYVGCTSDANVGW